MEYGYQPIIDMIAIITPKVKTFNPNYALERVM